eukprot:SAG31_NODE_12014_length_977_cov_1.466970_1_plen_176_part_01
MGCGASKPGISARAPQEQQKTFAQSANKDRILFIADNLSEYHKLIEAAKQNTIVVEVKYKEWSLQDLKNNVEAAVGAPAGTFKTIGFLEHGAPGEFCLLEACGRVDLESLDQNHALDDFFVWVAKFLNKQGPNRIDLMACSAGAGHKGKNLIATLQDLTGAHVAASIDATGAGANV